MSAMDIFFWMIVVGTGGAAVILWFQAQPDHHPAPESAEAKALKYHLAEPPEPKYIDRLISSYGFVSVDETFETGELYDIRRYQELPIEKRFITIDPVMFGNEEWLNTALGKARRAMNARARRYNAPIDDDNLRLPDEKELAELDRMVEVVQGPRVKIQGRKH